MKTTTRSFALALSLSALLGLAACSREVGRPDTPAATSQAITRDQAMDAVASRGKGFTAGALMSAQVVYVLFDPQCSHCAHLWQSSQPLMDKARFVWMPVSLLGPKSLPQGAAILQAPSPVEAMATHEQSLTSGTGGISASAGVPADIEQAIKANTQLLNDLGADAVPYIVTRHRDSGAVVTQAGSMGTEALARLIGL